jgi:TolB-like protein/DNA-binding winged helix-turn-helix (wHTH) protein/tetratricopeptide (TPR) repeat protein
MASNSEIEASKQLGFDAYVLDLGRGSLFRGEDELPLRPKTFAVLSHLVRNHGRLVSKDELFTAVWPNIAVTDDTLVQSIGELRRALGEDASRLIKTLPRRGYRFDGEVRTDLAADARLKSARSSSTPIAAADHPKGALPDSVRKPFRRPTIPLLGIVGVLILTALWASGSGLGLFTAKHPGPTGTVVGAKPAIAVLPFEYQGDDKSRDYFADGLTQDVITALGRFSELTVMSWNAVFPYKNKHASPGNVARELSARYQLEGSVRESEGRVRVTAQLVDEGAHVLWSGSFDEPRTELFTLQDKITAEIARRLPVQVSQIEQRRVLARPTENLEAYEYIVRARPALQRPERANIVEARELLRRATTLDPNYASAYAALAETYHLATVMGWAESPSAFLARAAEFANKALSLNESDVRAHVILGRIHIFYRRYEQAKAEIDRAIAINPNDADGLAGRGNVLMWSGQTKEAIEVLELALRINPELNPVDRAALSLAYYLKQRYGEAAEQAEINLRRTEAANFSRVVLAAADAQLNRSEEAARAAEVIRRLDPTFDPQEFGSKFLSADDLEHLREGLRKAGLFASERSRN